MLYYLFLLSFLFFCRGFLNYSFLCLLNLKVSNLKKKLELIKIAEDNKESDDFHTVTPLMKKIQSDWKKIGHVPRKDSDKIWKQFKTACNFYFDRMNTLREQGSPAQIEAFNKKTTFLETLKSFSKKVAFPF